MLQNRLNANLSSRQIALEEASMSSDVHDELCWDSAAVTADVHSVSMPRMHGEDSFEDTMAED
jgi:hypothetical protein